MIKFFRQIRQSLIMKNQTGKYFKYAIGEIILVVIGILIALQVNNWNEHRKLKRTQSNYLEQLSADIDSMQFHYKGIVGYREIKLNEARESFKILQSCKITKDDKNIFDEALLSYNDLGVLFEIRDTYDEMLSANLVASIENKNFKNIITEFYGQRDAMQVFIEQFKENLNSDYLAIKEHVVFGFNEVNQPTVEYKIEDLCNKPDFTNALVNLVRTRENAYRMVVILSQKLERMQGMLSAENDKF
ncbi:DUF6090 family protein [Winogradskyella alexanderae]|uniref:Uncharacterized protein n=1 Tax=Winogradskyella alexanderae TaxID=2877123 RepID=A0ABS7XUX5_9FLAO|nr:DUF6090 family protein [Winogradskyella alexanderae]MCA0133813.1 hypothetical protein [Winogradskyella alexanderae]